MSFSAGTFSINSTGQPVVAGTSITAAVFNAFTADVATGLSTCMLKDGTQTATAGIGFFAGTVSLPGIYFGTDTATGFYRIGLNNTGFAINGTKLLDLSATAFAVTGTGNFSGAMTLQSTLAVTGISTLTGNVVHGAKIGVNGVTSANMAVAVNLPNADYIAWFDAGSSGAQNAAIRGSGGGLQFSGSVTLNERLVMMAYTVAGVPSASPSGALIYVNNEAGGAVPAFSDGVNWRRVTDRAIVS